MTTATEHRPQSHRRDNPTTAVDRLLVVLLGLAAIFAIAPAASGYVLQGCKFASSVTPSVVYEENSLTTDVASAVSAAQGQWDVHTGSTTYFVAGSGDANIEINDGDYGNTAWVAQWSYGCSGGYYTSDEGNMNFNLYHTWSYDSYELQVVATHEFGHAYGLGHNSDGCGSWWQNVMQAGPDKFTCSGGAPPWTDDVNGWDYLY